MICPACGANNREGARFCRVCGRPVAESQHEDTQPQEQAVDEQAAPLQGTQPVPEEEPAPEVPGEEVPPDAGSMEASPGEAERAVEQERAAAEEAVEPGMEQRTEELPADAMEPPPDIELPAGHEAASEIEPEVDLPAPGADQTAQDAGVGAEPLPAGRVKPGGREAGSIVEPALELDEEVDIDDDELLGAFWREEHAPIEPALPGTLIADRYLVLEVLDAEADEVLYLTRDLQRCWQCNAEIQVDEAFCPECGAAQEQPAQRAPEARLLEVRDGQDVSRPETNVLARITHEGRPFLVIAELEPEPEPAPAAPPPESIRLIVGQRSDPGQVRELDEDSVLAIHVSPTYEAVTSPVLGLFAVADGMGGHEGGEIASKLALQVVADRTLRTIVLPELAGELMLDEDILVRLRQAVLAANDAVYLARQKRGNDMGTTLTMVLLRDRRLFVAHVGDCRAYRWSDAGLEQLTTDHSVVASMIADGQLKPDEIYTHPHRSVVYRCVGDQPTVEVDGDLLPLEPGDRIVVCSDGLWEMVRSEGIADVMMQEANPQLACDLLVRLANAAGGEDNISVVIVQVEAA